MRSGQASIPDNVGATRRGCGQLCGGAGSELDRKALLVRAESGYGEWS